MQVALLYSELVDDMSNLEAGMIAPELDVLVGEISSAITHYGEFRGYMDELDEECEALANPDNKSSVTLDSDEIAELEGLQYVMSIIGKAVASYEENNYQVVTVDSVANNKILLGVVNK